MTTPETVHVWDEHWRPVPVPGYEMAYSVSSLHRVRSEYRHITHIGPGQQPEFTRTVRTRILRASHDGGVTLSVNGVPRWVRIDDLVQAAFGEAA